eukprot:scaffold2636_cov340-Pavlova_lutheri.AAC.38
MVVNIAQRWQKDFRKALDVYTIPSVETTMHGRVPSVQVVQCGVHKRTSLQVARTAYKTNQQPNPIPLSLA